METLAQLSIADLAGMTFYIPWYQRGYRWTPTEVKMLLDDIDEFGNKEERGTYCLQPICVSKYGDSEKEWVVIDGQQRLTTIYLILYYATKAVSYFGKHQFAIKYDTRESIDDFLLKLDPGKTSEEVSDNQDEAVERYYLQSALCEIKTWFDTHDLLNFMTIFVSSGDKSKSVELIRYNTQATTESENIHLFNRINSGKIPLTNAELIKALLLNAGNEEKQYLCAEEWNRIENELADDEFWHFIYAGPQVFETRIDLLFSMFLEYKQTSINKHECIDRERLQVFYGVKKLVDAKQAEEERFDVWHEITDFYARIREWYNEREYFHRVGFLVQCGVPLIELLRINKDKKSFMADVIEKIRICIKKNWPADKQKRTLEIEALDYDAQPRKIRELLLLFNIESILQNPKSGYRFSFANYSQRWDLEHIRSQSSGLPEKVEEQRKWFKCILQYYTGIDFEEIKAEEQEEKIREWLDENTQCDGNSSLVRRLSECVFGEPSVLAEKAGELYADVIKRFNENSLEAVNDIGNLVLLDEHTNRSYHNAPFPVKRARIINNSAKGVFVPPCTLNAFLKYYSKIPRDVLLWSDDDVADYRQAIVDILGTENLKYLP